MTVSIHEHETVVAERDALRREVDRLKSENNKLGLNFISISGQAFDAWADSAASQAREQQLREALHYSLGAWHYDGVSEEHGSIFQEASYRCDSPADTAALQAMIKKAGEVMRGRAIAEMSDIAPYEHRVEKLNTIPSITIDDLKGGA